MILVDKHTNTVYTKAVVIGDKAYPNGDVGFGFCPLDDFRVYHSDSEVQQKIESAVAEHDELMTNEMKEWKNSANKYNEEFVKLLDCNNILSAENEQLKAKIPQPVEISQELAEVIEQFKERYNGISNYDWQYKFITQSDCSWLSDVLKNHYCKMSVFDAFEIIKNGYIVKPEPTLQESIEKILRALEYDLSGVEQAAKEIVTVLKHEGLIKDEEA